MGFRPGAPEIKVTKSGDSPFAKTHMHAFMKIDPAIEPINDEIIITAEIESVRKKVFKRSTVACQDGS